MNINDIIVEPKRYTCVITVLSNERNLTLPNPFNSHRTSTFKNNYNYNTPMNRVQEMRKVTLLNTIITVSELTLILRQHPTSIQ